ncbi:MAG TPA: hypothetical protein VMF50_02690, partial [Candidatus Binataceae bacterium]|nr:hypothetical protein [Candidatus Binataceae bacterium]
VLAKVNPLTGDLSGPYCPSGIEGVFPKSMAPTQTCASSGISVTSTSGGGGEAPAGTNAGAHTNTDSGPQPSSALDSPND